jgi:hypothetical protein
MGPCVQPSLHPAQVLRARQDFLPLGRTRAKAAAERAATAIRQATLKRGRGLAAAGYQLGTAPAAARGGGAPCAEPFGWPPTTAGARADGEGRGGRPWWEPSGLDPSALLLAHPAAAGAESGGGAGGGAAAPAQQGGGLAGARGVRLGGAAAGRLGSAAMAARRASSAPRTPATPRQQAPGKFGARAARAGSPAPPGSAGLPGSAALASGAAAGASSAEAGAAGGGLRLREQLVSLLRAEGPARLAASFAALPDGAAAAVVSLLFGMQPCGPQAAAALLEALSPVTAARLLMEPPMDAAPALLAPPLRARLLQLMSAPARDNARAAAAAVAAAAAARAEGNLAALREFAWGRCVSARQLVAVLTALWAGVPEDRCSAVVTLWSRVVDRSSMVEVGAQQQG